MGQETEAKTGAEAIELFVGIPDCAECRRKINRLMMEMGCWERVEIGYPTLYGSQVRLVYRDKFACDFWEKGREAKNILQSYQYRVL